jgi:hypothetical protein
MRRSNFMEDRTAPYDPAEFLTDSGAIEAYLAEAKKTNDPGSIAKAEAAVERAGGGLRPERIKSGTALVEISQKAGGIGDLEPLPRTPVNGAIIPPEAPNITQVFAKLDAAKLPEDFMGDADRDRRVAEDRPALDHLCDDDAPESNAPAHDDLGK